MEQITRIYSDDLAGKIIDVHSHVGVSVSCYAGASSYPYAQSAESLYYRQISQGIDVNVVFCLSGDLHFNIKKKIAQGIIEPAEHPISEAPFELENLILCREVYEWCNSITHRFLPFVSIDTGRSVSRQIKNLESLEQRYPIYGMKVHGVGLQTKVINILSKGRPFLEFAESRGIPILFHTTSTTDDEYSHASDVLKIVEKHPENRFCLAHCILFHRGYLKEAHQAPNAWVDTSALKIQVDLLKDCIGTYIDKKDVIDADFSDHRKVMQALCSEFPGTIIWGTDAPAYTYIARRKQGSSNYRDFRYSGTYEDETAALKSLPDTQQKEVSGMYTRKFLFGA